MTAADGFCDLLRSRLALADGARQGELVRAEPADRCDQLFLLAADFSDDLRRFAAGTLGPDTLRMGALEVAAAAFAVYIATVEGGPEDGC